MRNFLGDFSAQLKGIWSRLDGGQRLVVVSVLLATLAGIGGMVWFAGRPSYETVYTASNAEDAKAAQRALQDVNIPYVPNGLSFQVERSKAVEAGLAIQGAGLANGGSAGAAGASSIIDDADTRAWKLVLQSIARAESAVGGLVGVAGARITASPAKRMRAFVDRDRESRPTATVLLTLKPGASFVDVRGTAASLTASQLGLPVQNVTVANAANGQRWTFDPDRDSGNGGTSDFRAMERAISAERTQNAQDLLDRMWPGKASVTVNVELDPNWEIVSEKIAPSSELVKSEKITKDTSDQKSGSAGTTAPNGSRTVSSPSAATEPSSTENTTKNETRDREFVTEVGERRSGRQAAEIKRITVAVVYDKTLAGQGSDFDPKNLESAVKAMVGWDKNRDTDDGFSLLAGEFTPLDPAAIGTTGGGLGELVLQWGPTVGQVLGVAVVLLFLRGLLKRSARSAAAGAAAAADAEPPPAKPDSPEEMQRKMRKEIERAIASDPAALAKLLETWLIEQKA